MIDNSNTGTNKSFDYKGKIIGSSPDDNETLDTRVICSLKYLKHCLPVKICEIELDLICSKDCITFEILRSPGTTASVPQHQNLA